MPSKEDFKNDLTGFEIPQEEYDLFVRLWTTLKLEDLGQLHDIYLLNDVVNLTGNTKCHL